MKAELQNIAARLRQLAKETEETAIGSSRFAMYTAIATELRGQAALVDSLSERV